MIDKAQETSFRIRNLQPGGCEVEVNFLGRGDPCGMRGLHQQAQPGDGAELKLSGCGMLEGIGVGMQLAAVEGDLGRLGLGGLEIHYAMGAIVKINRGVDLAAQEAAQAMTGQRNGYRFDPLF